MEQPQPEVASSEVASSAVVQAPPEFEGDEGRRWNRGSVAFDTSPLTVPSHHDGEDIFLGTVLRDPDYMSKKKPIPGSGDGVDRFRWYPLAPVSHKPTPIRAILPPLEKNLPTICRSIPRNKAKVFRRGHFGSPPPHRKPGIPANRTAWSGLPILKSTPKAPRGPKAAAAASVPEWGNLCDRGLGDRVAHMTEEQVIAMEEVRDLPDDVVPPKRVTAIMERVAERRRERMDRLSSEVEKEMEVVGKDLEARVTEACALTKRKLEEDSDRVETQWLVPCPANLNQTTAGFDQALDRIAPHFQLRMKWIDDLEKVLRLVEKLRSLKISNILKKTKERLTNHVIEDDIDELVLLKADAANLAIAANWEAVTSLTSQLRALEPPRQQRLEERCKGLREDFWYNLAVQYRWDGFGIVYREAPVLSDIMECVKEELSPLLSERAEILDWLTMWGPPFCAHSSVACCVLSLRVLQQRIAEQLDAIMGRLEEEYQQFTDETFPLLDELYEEVLAKGVSEDLLAERREMVTREAMAVTESYLAELDVIRPQVDRAKAQVLMLGPVELLCRFVEGLAQLWDLHQKQLTEFQEKLPQQMAERHRELNGLMGGLELSLSQVVKAARKADTMDDLDCYLEMAEDTVDVIKESFDEFYEDKMRMISVFPESLPPAFDRYLISLYVYFHIDRVIPPDPDAILPKALEPELKQSVWSSAKKVTLKKAPSSKMKTTAWVVTEEVDTDAGTHYFAFMEPLLVPRRKVSSIQASTFENVYNHTHWVLPPSWPVLEDELRPTTEDGVGDFVPCTCGSKISLHSAGKASQGKVDRGRKDSGRKSSQSKEDKGGKDSGRKSSQTKEGKDSKPIDDGGLCRCKTDDEAASVQGETGAGDIRKRKSKKSVKGGSCVCKKELQDIVEAPIQEEQEGDKEVEEEEPEEGEWVPGKSRKADDKMLASKLTADMETLLACLESMEMPETAVHDLTKMIRLNFLNHLDTYKAKIISNAEALVQAYSDEMACQNDVRVHFHTHRLEELEHSVFEVRSKELENRMALLQQHLQFAKDTNAYLEKMYEDILSKQASLREEFLRGAERLEHAIQKEDVREILYLQNKLSALLDKTMSKMQLLMLRFQRDFNSRVTMAKRANQEMDDSTVLFEDGGSFGRWEFQKYKAGTKQVFDALEKTEFDVKGKACMLEALLLYQLTCESAALLTQAEACIDDSIMCATINKSLADIARKEVVLQQSNKLAEQRLSKKLATLRDHVQALDSVNMRWDHPRIEELRLHLLDTFEDFRDRAKYLVCMKKDPLQFIPIFATVASLKKTRKIKQGTKPAPLAALTLVRNIREALLAGSGARRGSWGDDVPDLRLGKVVLTQPIPLLAQRPSVDTLADVQATIPEAKTPETSERPGSRPGKPAKGDDSLKTRLKPFQPLENTLLTPRALRFLTLERERETREDKEAKELQAREAKEAKELQAREAKEAKEAKEGKEGKEGKGGKGAKEPRDGKELKESKSKQKRLRRRKSEMMLHDSCRDANTFMGYMAFLLHREYEAVDREANEYFEKRGNRPAAFQHEFLPDTLEELQEVVKAAYVDRFGAMHAQRRQHVGTLTENVVELEMLVSRIPPILYRLLLKPHHTALLDTKVEMETAFGQRFEWINNQYRSIYDTIHQMNVPSVTTTNGIVDTAVTERLFKKVRHVHKKEVTLLIVSFGPRLAEKITNCARRFLREVWEVTDREVALLDLMIIDDDLMPNRELGGIFSLCSEVRQAGKGAMTATDVYEKARKDKLLLRKGRIWPRVRLEHIVGRSRYLPKPQPPLVVPQADVEAEKKPKSPKKTQKNLRSAISRKKLKPSKGEADEKSDSVDTIMSVPDSIQSSTRSVKVTTPVQNAPVPSTAKPLDGFIQVMDLLLRQSPKVLKPEIKPPDTKSNIIKSWTVLSKSRYQKDMIERVRQQWCQRTETPSDYLDPRASVARLQAQLQKTQELCALVTVEPLPEAQPPHSASKTTKAHVDLFQALAFNVSQFQRDFALTQKYSKYLNTHTQVALKRYWQWWGKQRFSIWDVFNLPSPQTVP